MPLFDVVIGYEGEDDWFQLWKMKRWPSMALWFVVVAVWIDPGSQLNTCGVW